MGRLTMMLNDVRGRSFASLGDGPLRLVSLVPSSTESLFALGRGEALVGYTRFCVHPTAAIRREKWVGGTKNPRIEQIIALAPDLVIANREENRREDIEALEAAGLAVWVAEPRTVTEAIAELRAMAILVGRAARGQELAAEIEVALAAARQRAISPPRSVAYLIWQDPWMVVGQETFVADLLAQGGGIVPFPGRYPEVALGALREVDLVLLASEPFPFAESHRAALLAQGFDPHRVRLVDGERLSWHGVRLRAALPYLGEMIAG